MALSRAWTISGLQVLNFWATRVVANSRIARFYMTLTRQASQQRRGGPGRFATSSCLLMCMNPRERPAMLALVISTKKISKQLIHRAG